MKTAQILREMASKAWEEGYRHPFVQELGKSTLPVESFRFYLLQDYLYLLSYAKVFALATAKAETEELMAHCAAMQHDILNGEMNLHRQYMAEMGVQQADIEAVRPSLYHKAYTSLMLSVAHSGSVADILATVLPCAWSYADYAARLAEDYADELPGNPYRSWIEMYTSEDYTRSITWIFDALDGLCENASEVQLERLGGIFRDSVEMEYLFWEMAYHRRMSHGK